ncbi:Lamin Tail Domain-Containing Protein 1 [Manis pentadactyla]|nr:Lamin Tail Domain-Containing Protein 1 [Manis pentadactyla]
MFVKQGEKSDWHCRDSKRIRKRQPIKEEALTFMRNHQLLPHHWFGDHVTEQWKHRLGFYISCHPICSDTEPSTTSNNGSRMKNRPEARYMEKLLIWKSDTTEEIEKREELLEERHGKKVLDFTLNLGHNRNTCPWSYENHMKKENPSNSMSNIIVINVISG